MLPREQPNLLKACAPLMSASANSQDRRPQRAIVDRIRQLREPVHSRLRPGGC